jgi:uncharacterized protein (DUF2147 family)
MRVRLPLAVAVLALTAPAAFAGSPVGDWMTPGGLAKARIAPCASGLCGNVVWLKHPLDPSTGRPQLDKANTDPALKSRPVLGMQFLKGFKPAGDNRWTGGRIYDPQSGKTYDSKMSLTADGSLKVEGCVAVFCQAQVWTPAR